MMELGKFKVYEELGHGGYGTVYRAYDTTLEVERAVKILHSALAADAGFIERFQREARVAARLEHPHIVPVYEIGEEGGYYYLAMKYMAGGSLKEKLEKDGPLAYQTALEMVGHIGSALQEAHEEGLVHSDVKPGNILLEKGGAARLADFGFARAMQAASSASLSLSGGMIGTPAYMAPELWYGKSAGPATDLYSLACIFYEMLAGRALFSGDTPPEVMRQHIMERPQFPAGWPQGVPGGFEGVLEKALAKEPGERYPGIGEFLEGLRELEQGREKPEHETGEAEPAWKKCERCGRIYDVSFPTCPHCRVQEKSEEADEKKPELKKAAPPAGKGERKPKNTLALAAVAGVVVLLIWGGIAMNPNREGQKKPAGLLATNTAICTHTPGATSTPQATSTPMMMISERDGMEMVYVPAGEFEMGSIKGDDDEVPVHSVYLDAYSIDKYEVTNAMYAAFLNEKGNQSEGGVNWLDDGDEDVKIVQEGGIWQPVSGYGNHPVVEVSWYGAQAYCEWVDRRMPSEAEWEKAARGTDERIYPWGNEEPRAELANYGWNEGATSPVGSYPLGASSYGVLDMSGNVWEWVNDWYGEVYYSRSPKNNPSGPSGGDYRVLRGGSWDGDESSLRSSDRYWNYPNFTYLYNGFRCAVSADSS